MNNKDFINRLIDYRVNTRGIKTKKEMAELLEINDSFYGMIERGDRKPSKDFLSALVKESGLKEPYWLYGIQDDPANDRDELQMVNKTLRFLVDEGIVDGKSDLSEEIKAIILNACVLDLKHLILKKEKGL